MTNMKVKAVMLRSYSLARTTQAFPAIGTGYMCLLEGCAIRLLSSLLAVHLQSAWLLLTWYANCVLRIINDEVPEG